MSTPLTWYFTFLNKRNLSMPDGRSLYNYKLDDSEYCDLQEVLTKNHINYHSYGKWDACFVLYASEWWRRNYTNGHWSWEPIIKSIKKDMTVNQRSTLVYNGFKNWKRNVYIDINGHNDFLATVIIECGLPLQAVNQDATKLKSLITNCYQDLSEIAISEYDSLEIVKRLAEQSYLPKSLKKEGFYVLVSQILSEAIKLKREFNLGQEKTPTVVLDQNKPNWREAFPLQVDNPAGRQFIDELLTEVSKVAEPNDCKFILIRDLVKFGEGWKVKTLLFIPNGFYDEKDLRIDISQLNSLPAKATVDIISSTNKRRQVGTAYKTYKSGKMGYKFSDIKFDLGCEANLESWKLVINQPESHTVVELPLQGGDGLNDDLPWVFVRKDDSWRFKSMASYRTQATSAMVISNRTWEATGDIEQISAFDELRNVYSISGESIIFAEDQKFRIITNSSKTDNFTYTLQGEIFPYSLKNGEEIYLGFPSLYQINNTTLRKYPSLQKLQVKLSGQKIWLDFPTNPIGTMEVRLQGEDTSVLFKKKITVLPANFNIKLKGFTPSEGKILFLNSASFRISLFGENIKGEIERTDKDHIVAVESLAKNPPRSINVLLEETSGSRINLYIPFPSKGSKFYDVTGNELRDGSKYSISNIYGLRLALYNLHEVTIKFELCSKTISDIEVEKIVRADTAYREIAVSDFIDLVRKLFIITDDIDAFIKIKALGGPSIIVTRFSEIVSLNNRNKTVFITGKKESISNTFIKALRLDEEITNQTIENLPPIIDHYPTGGQWDFREKYLQTGKWLLFPEEGSDIIFRPCLWDASSKYDTVTIPETLTSFKESTHISKKEIRLTKLAELTVKMSKDFGNPNWIELDKLWGLTNHLPLVTLDHWTAFTRNKEALVALFFRQEDSLIDHFSEEFTVLWEVLPVQLWLDGATSYFEFLKHNQFTAEYADLILENKLQYLENQLDLAVLAHIIRKKLFSKDFNNESLCSKFQLDYSQLKSLLSNDKAAKNAFGESQYKLLLGRKLNISWPEYFSIILLRLRNKLPKNFEDLIPSNLLRSTTSVIHLPYVFAHASICHTEYSLDLFELDRKYLLREIIDFDKAWFSTAYNIAQYYSWLKLENDGN